MMRKDIQRRRESKNKKTRSKKEKVQQLHTSTCWFWALAIFHIRKVNVSILVQCGEQLVHKKRVPLSFPIYQFTQRLHFQFVCSICGKSKRPFLLYLSLFASRPSPLALQTYYDCHWMYHPTTAPPALRAEPTRSHPPPFPLWIVSHGEPRREGGSRSLRCLCKHPRWGGSQLARPLCLSAEPAADWGCWNPPLNEYEKAWNETERVSKENIEGRKWGCYGGRRVWYIHCKSSKNITSGLSLHAKEDMKPINTSLNRCRFSNASSIGTSGCGPA